MPKNKTPSQALATSVGLDSYAIANTAIAATQLFKIPARHPHGEGPWDNEADKIAWIDERTGIPCIILRQTNGTLSGYAAVEPGHPLYGYNHDAIPSELRVVSHGGLNYAEACNQTMPEAISVCHVEPLKRPHSDMPDRFADDGDLWWFGFDTDHAYDFVPNERIPDHKAHLPQSPLRPVHRAMPGHRRCPRPLRHAPKAPRRRPTPHPPRIAGSCGGGRAQERPCTG